MKRLELYGTPDCPYTRDMREWLELRGSDFVEYDEAYAIKFTILRERPSGSAGDPDIFGSQQYAPLLGIAIPVD